MDKTQRSDFRHTEKWHAFRAKCRLRTSTDFITKQPLAADWNLHHLDMNHSRYDDISDVKHFVPLNKETHNTLHILYRWYKKDHNVLERIKATLKKMEKLTNADTKGCN